MELLRFLTTKSIDLLNKNSKKFFICITLLGIIFILIQYYLFNLHTNNSSLLFIIVSILLLFLYVFISLYGIVATKKLQHTKEDLEQSKLYNKTLNILHDNIRCFKHDFYNIIQAIGGYVNTENIEGLKNYYNQISADCNKSNNLSTLNPSTINNPAIYNILASKYYKADFLNINMNFDILLDLNTLKVKIYEFTRVLGILLDNAIEASSECREKIINVIFKKGCNKQLVIIENTYNEKDIDIEKIYEKAYSTKPNNTGLGLWEVRKIIKRNENLNMFTTKNENYFIQQIEIY